MRDFSIFNECLRESCSCSAYLSAGHLSVFSPNFISLNFSEENNSELKLLHNYLFLAQF